ncbi:MAG: aminopeptidase P family protein [Lachnospiraceae bacterium]|nr:aminopeptidase P family protein [Lachnospiraceae bacterium]
MQTRYHKLAHLMEKRNLDAVLVSDGYNMRYLSGFTGATGYLLITKNSKTLFTDSRYTVAAMAQAPDYTVVEVDAARDYCKFINPVLEAEKVECLGFEALQVCYAAYENLKERLLVKELVPLRGELAELRRIKTAEEIALHRQAEHIGDIAFTEILKEIKPGMTELEISAKLEYIMKQNGADKLSFESIVASGVNSSKPHAEPGYKKIESGDFLTMDFGCVYQGYCSDMTRTIVVGKASEKQKEIYNTVLMAQTAVLAMLKPGLPGKAYDKVARDIICQAGYEGYFGHGLGHSVGLEIHENPRFSMIEEERVEAGMIMTVEPGIYIPDFGGVRIEDMVVLTTDGYENLTHSKKELIEL